MSKRPPPRRTAPAPDPAPQADNNAVGELTPGGTITAVWESLGVRQGVDPLPLSRARFVLGGLVKDGKSTLMASREGALVLDFEDAIRNVKGARAHYLPIVSWSAFEKVKERLLLDAKLNKRVFNHVVFDTVDRFCDIIADQICAEYKRSSLGEVLGGKGGWSLMAKRLRETLTSLFEAGYGWTCVVHMKWATGTTDDDKEFLYTKYCPTPGVKSVLDQEADYLCQIGSEIVRKEEPDPKNPRMKIYRQTRRVLLNTCETATRSTNAEVGTRVTLPEYIEVPLVNGFDAVEEAWQIAAQKLIDEDRQIRGG